MELIMFVVASLIVGTGLVIAFSPEIIATIAGEKKNCRLVGLRMISHKRNKGPYDPFKIKWYHGLGWVFLGMCVMDIITNSPMTAYSAIMSLVFFRISENWALTNKVLKELDKLLP